MSARVLPCDIRPGESPRDAVRRAGIREEREAYARGVMERAARNRSYAPHGIVPALVCIILLMLPYWGH